MTGRVVRSVLILAIGYAVGGPIGLAAAVVAVAVREAARLPVRVLWVGAVLAIVAAPVATIAQGLPSTPIVGVRLTATHLAANALVIVSLILALHAGLVELTDPASADVAPLVPTPGTRRIQRPGAPGATEPDVTETAASEDAHTIPVTEDSSTPPDPPTPSPDETATPEPPPPSVWPTG